MESTSHWVEINQSLWALADSATGEILAKVVFKEFWQHKLTQYLTLEQAQAAAENALTAEKFRKERVELPWNA